MTTLMTPFEFEKPNNLSSVFKLVEALKENKQSFAFAGGSTDLLPMFKQGINVPDCLISLTDISELSGITILEANKDEANANSQQNHIRIGASTRLSEIVNSKAIKEYFPELARTAGLVANPQIRNQATIGGNLLVDNRCIYINQSENNRSCHSPCFKADGDVCHLVKSAKAGDETLCQARFVSDTAPILMLLDAELVLQNINGERKVAIRDFYRQDGIQSNQLQEGELLVAIEIPDSQGKPIHYQKLAIRNTLDFPSVGVAVSVKEQLGKEGFIMEVALTGIQTMPGYLSFSSKDFADTDALLEQACLQANKFSLLYQQDFFPRAYRKKMIAVYIRRCFEHLIGNTRGNTK